MDGASLSACPACVAAPAALDVARAAPAAAEADRILLSVPGVHCAACISTLEHGLARVPGVRSARLNLTLRRLSVQADPGVTAADLIPAVAGFGYEAHELDPGTLVAADADAAGRDLLMRLAVAFFAMMNVMLLSVAVWSGAPDATRDLFHWISGAIALPTVAFSGQPFFRSALGVLKHGRANMDVPISIALVLASAVSLYETSQSGHHAYFDATVMLTFFLLGGRYLDHRSRAAARSAAAELAALEVPRALRVTGDAEALVPAADLRPGDLIRVLPGARLPADGVVTDGASEVDRSLLTGETLPVAAGPGTAMAAGEVNLTGVLTLRVTAAGRDTALARMTDLVAVAEAGRGRFRTISDRAVRFYTPFVHACAALTFLGWMATEGDLRHALNIAASVLIITCPCALGLAVPAVMTAASGRLFRRGLLLKDGTALERLAEVDTVVFDKTGTLTLGRPEVQDLRALPPRAQAVAAAMAAASAHPLALAVAEAARAAGVQPARIEDAREVPGSGVTARLGDVDLRFGRADWCGATDDGLATSVWLRIGAEAPVRLTFTDRLRPGAEALVDALRAQGMRLAILSGDADGPVRAVADRLGIDDWQARLRPEDKLARLQEMKAAGARVLMVGDGLNDTAALAGAHVSVSPASALDAARAASDVVLMGSSLEPVAEALAVARRAVALMRGNIVISNLYNVVAVPIAVAGFATPLAAAIAMSVSSVSVTLNALRIRS
ncbi:MAG: cadmium-translocating P-type ATPase [Rhodobacteraceae bacterium]|jgi:Cu2+-exporting ATPase|nr:cadmium-translocating P-type ATPase [Paracoccaceae bacterium]